MKGNENVIRRDDLVRNAEVVGADDLVERVDLGQTPERLIAYPLIVRGFVHLPPQHARGAAITPFRQGIGRERLQPPRRPWHLAGPLEPRGRLVVVAQPPVVDEADVHQVLPPLWRVASSLLEKRHRQPEE